MVCFNAPIEEGPLVLDFGPDEILPLPIFIDLRVRHRR